MTPEEQDTCQCETSEILSAWHECHGRNVTYRLYECPADTWVIEIGIDYPLTGVASLDAGEWLAHRANPGRWIDLVLAAMNALVQP
jgi:hypothetical protein